MCSIGCRARKTNVCETENVREGVGSIELSKVGIYTENETVDTMLGFHYGNTTIRIIYLKMF